MVSKASSEEVRRTGSPTASSDDTGLSFSFPPVRPEVATGSSLPQFSPVVPADRDLIQNVAKPLKFFSRKSKARKVSKLDVSFLEDLSVLKALILLGAAILWAW